MSAFNHFSAAGLMAVLFTGYTLHFTAGAEPSDTVGVARLLGYDIDRHTVLAAWAHFDADITTRQTLF